MTVVHIKKAKYDVYIGRPSIFGNPYSLDKYPRDEAIALYEIYARNYPKLLATIKTLPEDAILGCWCSPRPCHGEIIMKLWGELNHASSE